MRLRPLYVSLIAAAFVSADTGGSQHPLDSNNNAASNPAAPHKFSQLIDHTQPSLGTFNQRYFFSDEFWTGQGAPIIIFTPGEQSAEKWNTTLQNSNALIWDRYWGSSSPYQTLSTDNMKYLTVDQSIEDMKYFIETVNLPWKKATRVVSRPDASPWVHLGCSYPGVLVAYTQNKYPNLFAAAWASSAPVQAQGEFWQYFEPIEEGMPKNCSKDLASVITAVDRILLKGSKDEKHKLKETFGLENLEDDGDFGRRLTFPLFDWQSLTASTYKYVPEKHVFFQFCDAIETRQDKTFETSADGCNHMFPNGDGTPGNFRPSKFGANTAVEEQKPQTNNLFVVNGDGTLGNFHPDVFDINKNHGGGWNLQANNLFVVNGQFDPWRSASLSSKWAPVFQDTPHQDVEIVKDGHHCWDWNPNEAVLNPDIKRVVDLGIRTVKGWLQEWYGSHPDVKNSMPTAVGEFWKDIRFA
ncbi:hypothetical protein FS837_006330 [Tulasnella sp. UAMH 9824]|nr:hypothetical protein FS837_006330 [Tulasnella sp. UAMH 9824]